MTLILAVITAVLGLFGFVVLLGAPYLPTLKPQQQKALDYLGLKPGQHFFDLGCGDGRLLLVAAKHGYRVTGVEINPLLVIVAHIYCFRHRKQIKIIWGNFWKADIKDADGIFVFLLDKYMTNLDKFIASSIIKPVRLVSFAFQIPDKSPAKSDKSLYLYTYTPK